MKQLTLSGRACKVILVSDATSVGFEALVLENVGYRVFGTGAMDRLGCAIVRIAGQSPGHVPEISAGVQCCNWFTNLLASTIISNLGHD